MNVGTLFERFDLLAETPNAIPRLRELVLQLAVRGKLVPQNPEDEPAEELLSHLQTQNDLAFERLHSKKRELPVVVEGEELLAIPESWRWVRLANVGGPLGQKKPDEPFTYIDVGSINAARGIISDTLQVLSPEMAPSRARKIVQERTVIYSTVRPYLLNTTIVDRAFRPQAIASTAFAVLHPFDGMQNRFILLWLRSPVFNEYVSEKMKGMAYPAISDDQFFGAPIPLPPLAEQKRIVAKVDELMAHLDRLEAQQKERADKEQRLARAAVARFTEEPAAKNVGLIFHQSYSVEPAELRKTILTLAVRGKLVPQDPNDEPAEELLRRVRGERDRSHLDENEFPFHLPEAWCWARMQDLSDVITKGSSPKWQGVSYVPSADGVLFITSENVGNYTLRKLNELKYVENRFNEIEPRSILRNGDLLINLVGASIGRSALYDLKDGANINQAVALVRLAKAQEKVDPFFLLHYLNSPSAITYMLSSRVISAQPNMSLTDVRELLVPLPPLAEQKRIVAKVDELMALVDRLEKQLQQGQAVGKELMEAVVGEMVG